jgi:hypothetical protein
MPLVQPAVTFDHDLFDLPQKARLAGDDPGEILLRHPSEQTLQAIGGFYLSASRA